jgi:DNA-directed RNA polymerase subunit N (RpoN/RPB10)
MIIPVRCFTCGNVLADKELAYRALVQAITSPAAEKDIDTSVQTATPPFIDNINTLLQGPPAQLKSAHGKALDTLGVVKMCCRRHMLSSVDVLEDI